MASTESFKQQHVEILGVAREMSPLLSADRLAKDARAARESLSSLAGKVKVHLAMEDNALYPRLLKHPDPGVRKTTEQFLHEMGAIKDVFGKYMSKWPTPAAIQEHPGDFVPETKGLFEALSRRIQREEKELYPLVDRPA